MRSLFQGPRQPSIDPALIEVSISDIDLGIDTSPYIDQIDYSNTGDTIEPVNSGGSSGGGSANITWFVALFSLFGLRRLRLYSAR